MVSIADCIALAGLVLIAVGLWWIYPPACLVVVGSLLLWTGVVGAKAKGGGA